MNGEEDKKKGMIISTDFDGTLISETPKEPICEDLVRKIKSEREENGSLWVINTGRDWQSLKMEIREREFSIFPDWVILLERYIFRLQEGRIIGGEKWNQECTTKHRGLFAELQPLFEKMKTLIEKEMEVFILKDLGSPLSFMTSNIKKGDAMEVILKKIMEENEKASEELILVRNTTYFRFSAKGYHKGTALEAMGESLNIGKENILAVGDHWNDIPMLDARYAKWVGCPSNALEEVKEQVRSQSGVVAQKERSQGVLEVIEKTLKKCRL